MLRAPLVEIGQSQSQVTSAPFALQRPPPPAIKVNTICKVCGKEPYVVERVVAEKSWWHKNCFRCNQCNKLLTLDTYMSHEGVLYCKQHHRELFQPKVVKEDLVQLNKKAVRLREKERIVQEMTGAAAAAAAGEGSGTDNEENNEATNDAKFKELENLDVGSKFRMFEKGGGGEEEDELRPPSSRMASDRYGIMDKLKRLQEGEDFDDLLAEMDEEMPKAANRGAGSDSESGADDAADFGGSALQAKKARAEKMWEGEKDRKQRLAEKRKAELKHLREKLMTGTRDAVLDNLGDLLNASANRVKKTKVDVKSQNAAKFREMFDKGEVPDGAASTGTAQGAIAEKEQELEMMRKSKREQKEFFQKLERGEFEESNRPKEAKMLTRKIKDMDKDAMDGEIAFDAAEMPEMTPLSNRFSFFEHFEEKKEAEEEERSKQRAAAAAAGQFKEGEDGGDPAAAEAAAGKQSSTAARLMTEADMARRECKARSVLNKWKEAEKGGGDGAEDNEGGKAASSSPARLHPRPSLVERLREVAR